jgi:arabinogalactan endo-1,4-beta-galactosidase
LSTPASYTPPHGQTLAEFFATILMTAVTEFVVTRDVDFDTIGDSFYHYWRLLLSKTRLPQDHRIES